VGRLIVGLGRQRFSIGIIGCLAFLDDDVRRHHLQRFDVGAKPGIGFVLEGLFQLLFERLQAANRCAIVLGQDAVVGEQSQKGFHIVAVESVNERTHVGQDGLFGGIVRRLRPLLGGRLLCCDRLRDDGPAGSACRPVQEQQQAKHSCGR
jgi:hypothetical protein